MNQSCVKNEKMNRGRSNTKGSMYMVIAQPTCSIVESQVTFLLVVVTYLSSQHLWEYSCPRQSLSCRGCFEFPVGWDWQQVLWTSGSQRCKSFVLPLSSSFLRTLFSIKPGIFVFAAVPNTISPGQGGVDFMRIHMNPLGPYNTTNFSNLVILCHQGHAGICQQYSQFCPFEELNNERDADRINLAVVNVDAEMFYSLEDGMLIFWPTWWFFTPPGGGMILLD